MTMSWLMTIQDAGTPATVLDNVAPWVQFDLTPRWISPKPDGEKPSPNPNRFNTLPQWPLIVEIRRPDGTCVTAEPCPLEVNINPGYDPHDEPDATGRILNLRQQQVIFKGVCAQDVPRGSEVWGEIPDDDLQDAVDADH